jgi:hypothetical protein
MTKTEKQMYFNKQSIAYYSGLNGLEIKEIVYDTNDYIIFVVNCWYGKNSYKDVHKSKIYYSNNSDYFRFNGYRILLNECIRMNLY